MERPSAVFTALPNPFISRQCPRINRNLCKPSKGEWRLGLVGLVHGPRSQSRLLMPTKKSYPIVPFLMGRNSMGCCISRRLCIGDDRTPLQKDQERFQSIQAPDQPMREVRYLDKDGKEQQYWARHNEALRTEGRSIMRRQDAVKLDV
jgi:hypothetical protein